MTREERFWAKVNKRPDGECWLWVAELDVGGYGRFWVGRENGRNCMAHRFAYELLVGPIPNGLQLDHLCRNRACVNPSHLEPVTARENVRRGVNQVARNMVKDRCLRGHEFTAENTYTLVRPDGSGWRCCRACNREKNRDYRARKAAA